MAQAARAPLYHGSPLPAGFCVGAGSGRAASVHGLGGRRGRPWGDKPCDRHPAERHWLMVTADSSARGAAACPWLLPAWMALAGDAGKSHLGRLRDQSPRSELPSASEPPLVKARGTVSSPPAAMGAQLRGGTVPAKLVNGPAADWAEHICAGRPVLRLEPSSRSPGSRETVILHSHPPQRSSPGTIHPGGSATGRNQAGNVREREMGGLGRGKRECLGEGNGGAGESSA